jgi:hypothetical protein
MSVSLARPIDSPLLEDFDCPLSIVAFVRDPRFVDCEVAVEHSPSTEDQAMENGIATLEFSMDADLVADRHTLVAEQFPARGFRFAFEHDGTLIRAETLSDGQVETIERDGLGGEFEDLVFDAFMFALDERAREMGLDIAVGMAI